MSIIKYLFIISIISIITMSAYAIQQDTTIAANSASISAQQTVPPDHQYTPPQKDTWLKLFYAALPFLLVVAFIALAVFFPVFTGFMSATAGLIIFGLLVLLLGSCFTGGIVWEGSGNPNNIFNILMSHFYIYIGIVLIALDLMMLGSIVISVIGAAFILWDIGISVYSTYRGIHARDISEIDLMVLGVLMGITTIVAFIYALRKQKNKKDLTKSHLYIGEIGTVIEKRVDNTYQVRINYEYWDAVSTDELDVDDNVEVVSVHNATLRVRKHFK
jgi:membrane-bound ClpP family serine protease